MKFFLFISLVFTSPIFANKPKAEELYYSVLKELYDEGMIDYQSLFLLKNAINGRRIINPISLEDAKHNPKLNEAYHIFEALLPDCQHSQLLNRYIGCLEAKEAYTYFVSDLYKNNILNLEHMRRIAKAFDEKRFINPILKKERVTAQLESVYDTLNNILYGISKYCPTPTSLPNSLGLSLERIIH